jgi:trehalose 6-phosphate synthase
MRNAIRFLAALTIGLGALSLVGYLVLSSTMRKWFESDVTMRSQLAVASARQSLVDSLLESPRTVSHILADITRDDRIMGAAVCGTNGELLAATDAFPEEMHCMQMLRQLGREGRASDPATQLVVTELPAGPVHLSGTAIAVDGRHLGTVMLVHDLSYLTRRATTARNLSIAAFFVLSLGASIITLIAMRLAWRNWLTEFRLALTRKPRNAFQPLVRDVRELVEQLVSERHGEDHVGRWSADRLKAVLSKHLHGERVVILANREPYVHERGPDGIRVLHPASGLVAALEPVMRACSGVWVAHGSGSADRETSDRRGRIQVPPGEESYILRRVWLTETEEKGYYYGLANEGLWPLCHLAHTRPSFLSDDWQHYIAVNRLFARAVVDESDGEDPIVFVQDYHFALAPKMIRELLPKATILTFWHIPWPNAERFGICPWREELIAGLLGSSILGFQTQQHCNNFMDSVDAFMESRIDREANAVVHRSRRTVIRPYPISIEWPVHWLKDLPSIDECRSSIRRGLGFADDVLIGIGIDRSDYTKGIEERFQAVDELMTRYPEFRGKFTFVQIAAPSRIKIDRYRELRARVDALTQAINTKWASLPIPPITLLDTHHEPPEVFKFFRSADLCYLSSLHDGMNLVAKEFVAARDDERGVLVLSQFTGAARDLTEALIVNPYDIRQASDALAAALRMSSVEQGERMRSMRKLVSEFNVYRWAGRMLSDAAEVRRRDRMMDRLSAHQSSTGATSA